LEYIGLAKFANAVRMLHKMIEINLESPWPVRLGSDLLISLLLSPLLSWKSWHKKPILCQP
jgi:hypothetical protein